MIVVPLCVVILLAAQVLFIILCAVIYRSGRKGKAYIKWMLHKRIEYEKLIILLLFTVRWKSARYLGGGKLSLIDIYHNMSMAWCYMKTIANYWKKCIDKKLFFFFMHRVSNHTTNNYFILFFQVKEETVMCIIIKFQYN